jgi:hypothetical protein
MSAGIVDFPALRRNGLTTGQVRYLRHRSGQYRKGIDRCRQEAFDEADQMERAIKTSHLTDERA